MECMAADELEEAAKTALAVLSHTLSNPVLVSASTRVLQAGCFDAQL